MPTSAAMWQADRWVEQIHANGGRCGECGARGGCVVLLGAVRRRTAPPPMGSRVAEILLALSQPVQPS